MTNFFSVIHLYLQTCVSDTYLSGHIHIKTHLICCYVHVFVCSKQMEKHMLYAMGESNILSYFLFFSELGSNLGGPGEMQVKILLKASSWGIFSSFQVKIKNTFYQLFILYVYRLGIIWMSETAFRSWLTPSVLGPRY